MMLLENSRQTRSLKRIASPKTQREEREISWKGNSGKISTSLVPSFRKAARKHHKNTVTSAPEKRRVHFDVDPLDTDSVKCYFYTKWIDNDDEIRETWYKASEIKQMRRDACDEAITARESTSAYLKQFRELFSVCENKISVVSLPKQLAKSIAISEYRGLEALTFVELIRSKPRNHVYEILATQECYHGLCTSEQLLTELRDVSKSLSEQSRRFAAILAIGDADAALEFVSQSGREHVLPSSQLGCDGLQSRDEKVCPNSEVFSTSPYEV